MTEYSVGSKVIVKTTPGIIRYIGTTQFAPGTWYGVELSQPNGKNNGSVEGVQYFHCKPNHGVFVRQSMLEPQKEMSPDLNNVNRIIDKLQNKLKLVTSESSGYKERISELMKESERTMERIGGLESKLEMQLLENEFLKSSNLELTTQLEELSDRYKKLDTEFHLIKEELEINQELEHEFSFVDVEQYSSDDIKSIVERNKQLESALVALKKLSEETENNLKKEIDELKLSQGIEERLEQFEELEKITEHLTHENHELSKTIISLNKTIGELNEIHDLDKQLEETQKQSEAELRKQVSNLTKEIEVNKEKIRTLEDKNKSLQKNIDKSVPEKDLTDYELELKSTQQTLRDLKAKSRADSIKLELVENRYSIVTQHTIPHELSDVILKFKLTISDLNVLSTKFPKKLSGQIYAYFVVMELQEFFKFVHMLLEYNPDLDLNLELLDPILNAITAFIQGDDLQQGIIDEFTQVGKAIHTIIEFSELEGLQLVDNLWVRFINSLLRHQHEFSKSIVEQYPNLRKQLDQLVQEDTAIDITKEIEFPKGKPNFRILFKQINDCVNELHSLITKDELSETQLSLSLENIPHIDFAYGHSIDPVSIYDIKPEPEQIAEKSEVPDSLVSELNSKILQKDQEISDLKLNITMLEQNMKSLTSQNTLNLENLQAKLIKQEQQIQSYLETIKSLELEKEDLKTQLTLVEKNTQEYDLVFNDLKSQHQYNENISFMEQISQLKQINKMRMATPKQDYSWLKKTSRTRWNETTPLMELSRDLRSIALDVKAVHIATTSTWRPKKNLPKYANLLIEERYTHYKSRRNNLL
ncbi:uncharacterized protein SPAPADRAFT_65423 [Spathaspora passalidarum NRRL Y-27907]|uniref:CAP-Gly domain-containing protein n=1 Tax=Spathaspora passalidarum (strain NRRL Y-27907 / 11-Y1) TaxID=619300 RepID=G3AHV4_SPAPN|nr:uncharacterized protein SPAPADRAFT_65423 [Spathaspora passalidarum NRRL Y-27907]EGW34267.1 hypothetical protein SPAPADRAFT_65423 [Spathaspora passalidarum NRRL Y-27907]